MKKQQKAYNFIHAYLQIISNDEGTFFLTFICSNWLSLIDKIEGYDFICNWFDHLKLKGHKIIEYVVMPDHVHVLINFVSTRQSINTIIGNGKRFMAYEIIDHLEARGESNLLSILTNNVEAKRKEIKSFMRFGNYHLTGSNCDSRYFIQQKLNYMHEILAVVMSIVQQPD